MKTKQVISILFLLLIRVSLQAQFFSDVEIIPVGSSLYNQMRHLFHEAGMQNFTRALPVSVAEARQTLLRLPDHRLAPASRAEKNRLLTELKEKWLPDFPLSFSIDLALETYLNTNSAYTKWMEAGDKVYASTDGNWRYGYKNRNVPIMIGLSLPVSSWLFAHVDGPLGKDPYQVGVPDTNYTNIPHHPHQIDIMAPYRAYISAGRDNIWLQWGRDRLSWGNGISGNMIVSDAPLYYDYIGFSWFFDRLKYTFVSIGLESWHLDRDFIDPRSGLQKEGDDLKESRDYHDEVKFFFGHKLEFYLLENLYLSISENTIFGGKPLTWNYFNPVMLYHSYYVQGYGNSIITLEASFSPARQLNLYTQIAIDQFEFPTSPSSLERDQEPGAMGYMAGLSWHPVVSNRRLTLGYEWAYTSPFLYYGSHYQADKPWGGSSPVLELSSRRRIHSLTDPVAMHSWVDQSIGYSYGPDVIANYLYLDLPDILPLTRIYLDFTWLINGERNMTSVFWIEEGQSGQQSPTGLAEEKFMTGLRIDVEPRSRLKIGTQLDFIAYRHLHHQKDNNGIDMQIAFYCRWKLL